jgi:ureidoacrylate peracid hydrolase
VILVADATASGKIQHYDTTLERVIDYYGIVTHLHGFEEIIKILGQISSGKLDFGKPNERLSEFLEKHNLIDISKRV